MNNRFVNLGSNFGTTQKAISLLKIKMTHFWAKKPTVQGETDNLIWTYTTYDFYVQGYGKSFFDFQSLTERFFRLLYWSNSSESAFCCSYCISRIYHDPKKLQKMKVATNHDNRRVVLSCVVIAIVFWPWKLRQL